MRVTANHSKRTFTIRKEGSKYRTQTFTSEDFFDLNFNTSKDWEHFLRTNENYYLIK